MKTSLIVSISLALSACSVAELFAQGGPPAGNVGGPGGAPAGPPRRAPLVATIDVGRVMESYVKAKQYTEALRKDSEAAGTALRKESTKLEQIKEKLKNFKAGSPDFKRLEEEFAQIQSDLQIRAKIQERDFKERAMKQDFQLLSEISDEVKRYADGNGISLVFPLPNEQVDTSSLESVGRAVQRMQIVFYQNGPDITDAILDTLNRRAMQGPGQIRGAGNPNSQAPRR